MSTFTRLNMEELGREIERFRTKRRLKRAFARRKRSAKVRTEDTDLLGPIEAAHALPKPHAGPPTMDDEYGDGSDHEICLRCGLCKECSDCEKYGCGAR